MSTIQHGYFPRSAMNMDAWQKPIVNSPTTTVAPQVDVKVHDINTNNLSNLNSNINNTSNNTVSNLNNVNNVNKAFAEQWKKSLNTLDMFDPFDSLDHTIGRNMQWLNRPEFMQPQLPRVPQKYRVTLECHGYSPKSIKTEWKDNILTVTGCEKTKCEETGDFHTKEFKKTYTMPKHAECDKMVSFMTAEGQLVIEVPLKETEIHRNDDLFPQVYTDEKTNGKCMKMKFHVPENIAPEHIHINIKDRCLVVKAEEKKVKPDGVSTFHYYKKTTLPENTDWDALKCSYDNHKISVTAPLNTEWTPTKAIKSQHHYGQQHYNGQQFNGQQYNGQQYPIHGQHAIHDKKHFAGQHGETAWPQHA